MQRFRHAQRRRDAAAARAAGENSLLLGEAARPDETFFVIHLDHVVENREIHGGGQNIFADSFDHIGVRLAHISRFRIFVKKRAEGVHADHFHRGIFFLQVAARAADGAAGAHAADEVRDFAFRVIPNFGAGGAVMRLGIHRIFVLVRIVGVGNFARKFFCHGIVAARIFRFHGRGADDHFGAESLQHIDFFARLLVRDGENNFVAAHGGDQARAPCRCCRGAFDDGAAGLQQAFALGFVNHRDGDAVLHRAARIQIIGLHPHFGGQIARDAVQANQRRVADRVKDAVALHCEAFSERFG